MPFVIDDPRIKEKCQVFTPNHIVSLMLDLAGYKDNLYGKTILENCCGNGQFLEQITGRYIKDCKKRGLSPQAISKGLERDIVAYELDDELISSSKNRLDHIAEQNGLYGICWNINNRDFLDLCIEGQYDYIVGNPPYIAYQDLEEKNRNFLKENYETCKKGKCDYSYAFIEKSFKMLKQNAKLSYIIPSNFFKNYFAEDLRQLIKSDITNIFEFQQDEIFPTVMVAPAIICITKYCNTPNLEYCRVINGNIEKHNVNKERLVGKWIFDEVRVSKQTIGAYFKVSNTVATLYNRAFVLKDGRLEENYLCVGPHKIERSILRKAVSPRYMRSKKSNCEYIIFPYYYDKKENLQHYTEKEMLERFPGAMKYLEAHKEALEDRDADDNAQWYEYGRSQALQYMNRPMIMISSVISEETEAFLLQNDEIPYSGFYIIPTSTIGLEELMPALNSEKFKKYISQVGVSVSGRSKRITAKDIEQYSLDV